MVRALPLVDSAARVELGDDEVRSCAAPQSRDPKPSQARAERSGPEIEARLSNQDTRIHINIGPVCNNNCIFCMEEDRQVREVENSAVTPEHVREILKRGRGLSSSQLAELGGTGRPGKLAEEVCFTSGEPTLVRDLPRYLHWAKQLGYPRRSVMTNGRRLSDPNYARLLVKAGLNYVYVSIHGHSAKLHDALVRTPGAFEQTEAGLRVLASFGPRLVRHSSTVITHRNLPYLGEVYAFLRARGVDQVVFNVMQANGRGDTFFEQLFPPYAEIAERFAAFLSDCDEDQPEAYLVDIPLCATEGIPDKNRGYFEETRRFKVREAKDATSREALLRGPAEGSSELREIAPETLDTQERAKRQECADCRYDGGCVGVWKNYLSRYGWAGLEPVR